MSERGGLKALRKERRLTQEQVACVLHIRRQVSADYVLGLPLR